MMTIKSVDDLRAQQAQAHNDLQIAKSRLTLDKEAWLDEAKPIRRITYLLGNVFTNRYQGMVGKSVQVGVNALLGKTILRRLPIPLNFLVPHLVQNTILNYTHRHGDEWLLTGLRWLKEVTEDDEPTEDVERLALPAAVYTDASEAGVAVPIESPSSGVDVYGTDQLGRS
ncbi:hypothetical protein GCM10027275_19210 [Rhabdobacter roseus]|uniref:Uncharacterized protein n=1 Tax=Rhabdobacter roseus TaxID=1655419 RepID=A0A840TQ60_9BACT|nr:hypothetical protein [Rhabdobacter roseus]MBB5283847.1 hypothetical protein [Rhabdobacter roseus]